MSLGTHAHIFIVIDGDSQKFEIPIEQGDLVYKLCNHYAWGEPMPKFGEEPDPTPDQKQIVLNAEVISRVFSKEIFVEEFGTELAPEAQHRLFNLIVDKFLTPMIHAWYNRGK